MDYKRFTKAYECIITDKTIDLYESFLLCMYIEKYIEFGKVLSSTYKDAEYLKIDRKHVRKKREHLKELGFINYETIKGKPTEIRINPDLLKVMCINNKEQ